MFSGFMMNTWIAATIVAVIAGVVGFFAVLRGSTFAAHAIPNGAFAGAAGASLIGVSTLAGLAVFSVAGALGIAAFGRKARHDVATALILVLILGIGALYISLGDQYAQETYSLLFGEVFGISPDVLVPIAVLGALSVLALLVIFRPLMLTSAMPEVAAARGVSPRRIEMVFLLIMALATSMTVPVVGALLMFSLMIGPAAAAPVPHTHRPFASTRWPRCPTPARRPGAPASARQPRRPAPRAATPVPHRLRIWCGWSSSECAIGAVGLRRFG